MSKLEGKAHGREEAILDKIKKILSLLPAPELIMVGEGVSSID